MCKSSLVSNKRTLAPPVPDAHGRIAAAALRCFSRSGFAGTSLADIESEAGFSVGAGSTYRYYPSKLAMLEAAVTEALERADELSQVQPGTIDDAGRLALASMDQIRDLTRIVLRDLDRFPELLMPVVDRLLEGPVRAAGARMAAVAPGIDGEAMATLLIGALVNVKVIEALAGKRPGAVGEDRLLAAWAHLYRLALENPS